MFKLKKCLVINFVGALFIAISTIALSACEEDNSIELDDGTVVKRTEPGDNFSDEADSYVLSSSTQSSSVLPYDYESHLFTYHIRNASDLKLFCEQINNGEIEEFKNKFNEAFAVSGSSWRVTLEHDITIDSSFSWKSIGTGKYPMDMEFDGKEHTIFGTINSKGSSSEEMFYLENGRAALIRHGLFGYSQSAISNLNVEADMIINTTGTPVVIAGILCAESNGSVDNVKVVGNVTTPLYNIHCTELYLGYITGIHLYGNIKNCYSEGKIEFKKRSTGRYSLDVDNAYIGGLVGKTRESKIMNCTSSVDIDITDAAIEQSFRIGGVVAYTSSNMMSFQGEVEMLEVENYGNISIETPHKINYVDNANITIGGIIGYGRFNNGNSGKISNSGLIYLGSTSLIGMVGGIVGYYDGMDAVTDVTNNGDIRNHSKKSFTGGCYGILADVEPSIEHAYNFGNVSATEVVANTLDYHEHPHMIYGLVGGVVGKATISGTGLLGSSHRSGKIHQCYNSGDITSGDNFYYNGVECSPAGAISGDGLSVNSCNIGKGKINGEDAYPLSYNGTTWKVCEKILNGNLSEGDDYWSFWKDFRYFDYNFECSCAN